MTCSHFLVLGTIMCIALPAIKVVMELESKCSCVLCIEGLQCCAGM